MAQSVIEARKLAGTRSGRSLLIIVAGLVIASAALVTALPGDGADLKVTDVYAMSSAVLVLFVPIIVLVSFTSEWSTRSVLVTFTLTPRRRDVLAGKMLFGTALAVTAPSLAMPATVAMTEIAARSRGVSAVYTGFLGLHAGLLQITIHVLLYTILAAALAMLLRLTVIAAPVFLALTVFADSVLGVALGDSAAWVAPITGFEKLSSAEFTSGTATAQLITVALLWLVVPAVAGCWRFLHADVA